MVNRLNTSYDRFIDPTNPVYQVTEILNRHLHSLQWIDQQISGLQGKIIEADRHLKSQQEELEGQRSFGRGTLQRPFQGF